LIDYSAIYFLATLQNHRIGGKSGKSTGAQEKQKENKRSSQIKGGSPVHDRFIFWASD
jgi:hypothetical protein